MKCTRLLFVLVLLLQSLCAEAKPLNNAPYSCNLPAPTWINAVDISSTKIKVKWAVVSGASNYKVSRYDVTHNVQLPDAYTLEEEYLSEPHDPGTTITFTISPVCPSGEVSEAFISEDFTTTIIVVDDIASFSAPNTPAGSNPIQPGGDATYGFLNADKNAATVEVQRIKVKYGSTLFAEFLLWSHCSQPDFNVARIKYWNQPSWPASVTKTENHVNGPDSPISSITFKINGGPFFTIKSPSFGTEANGMPSTGQILIHNDRQQVITFAKANSTENNPCYAPPGFATDGGEYSSDDAISDDAIAQDRAAFQFPGETSMLTVSPNPFSEGFSVNYTLEQESPVTLLLFDHTGRQLRVMELPALEAGNYNTGIYTNDLPTGIYLLAFQTNQGRSVTTLVKQP